MEPSKFIIDAKILQTAVDYLASQPFTQVSGIIKAIQDDVKPYVEPETKKDKAKSE